MTSPMLPDQWMHPAPPRRRGRLERWCRWWDRRRRTEPDTLLAAYLVTWPARYAWPDVPEVILIADAVLILVVLRLTAAATLWAWGWFVDVRRAAAMLWPWHETPGSSGTCSTGRGLVTRAGGRLSAARVALRDARRARSA